MLQKGLNIFLSLLIQSLPLFLWCKSFVRVKDLNYHLVLIFDKYCKIKKNVVNIKSDMIMKI